MRLINVDTLCLEQFTRDPDPEQTPYAILSHTWEEPGQELSFEDVMRMDGDIGSARIQSEKLKGCCERAKSQGLKYVWIDTCCFNTQSQTEVEEAINSMFRWYEKSRVCYVLLSDLRSPFTPAEFKSCRWFGRGWTLQELLAPIEVEFYDANWNFLGTKTSDQLAGQIEEATRIPRIFLSKFAHLHEASVAQRMAWAAGRTTSREEDSAYCLLGIFGVHLTTTYGIGEATAFANLQDAIIRKTPHDDSILAWSFSQASQIERDAEPGGDSQVIGVLAPRPSVFEGSASICRLTQGRTMIFDSGQSGGYMRVCLPLHRSTSGPVTYGELSCGPGTGEGKVVAIPLVRHGEDDGVPTYARVRGLPCILIRRTTVPASMIHLAEGSSMLQPKNHRRYWIFIPPDSLPSGLQIKEIWPSGNWKAEASMIETCRPREAEEGVYYIRFRNFSMISDDFLARVVYESETSVYCDNRLHTLPRKMGLEEVAKVWKYLDFEESVSVTKSTTPRANTEEVAYDASMQLERCAEQETWTLRLKERQDGQRLTAPGFLQMHKQLCVKISLIEAAIAEDLANDKLAEAKAATDRIQDRLDKHKELLKEAETAIDSCGNKEEESQRDFQTRRAKEEAKRITSLNKLKVDHERNLEELKRKYEEELEKENRDYDEEIGSVEDSYRERIASLHRKEQFQSKHEHERKEKQQQRKSILEEVEKLIAEASSADEESKALMAKFEHANKSRKFLVRQLSGDQPNGTEDRGLDSCRHFRWERSAKYYFEMAATQFPNRRPIHNLSRAVVAKSQAVLDLLLNEHDSSHSWEDLDHALCLASKNGRTSMVESLLVAMSAHPQRTSPSDSGNSTTSLQTLVEPPPRRTSRFSFSRIRTSDSAVKKHRSPANLPPFSTTAIFHASDRGWSEICQLLIKYGADADSKCAGGAWADQTPLMLAAQNGHLDVVKILCTSGDGVNINALGRDNMSAAGTAHEACHVEVEEYLRNLPAFQEAELKPSKPSWRKRRGIPTLQTPPSPLFRGPMNDVAARWG